MGTRRVLVLGVALAGAIAASAMVVRAAGPFKGHAQLTGYQEVPTLWSPASDSFDVEISKDGTSLSYTLSYAAVVAALRAEAGYANVHSSANPGGQLRGQVLFSRKIPSRTTKDGPPDLSAVALAKAEGGPYGSGLRQDAWALSQGRASRAPTMATSVVT